MPDKNLLFFFQIENELIALNPTNCSSDNLCNRPPTSFPKHIKERKATCTCTGGDFFAQGNGSWFLLQLSFLSLRWLPIVF